MPVAMVCTKVASPSATFLGSVTAKRPRQTPLASEAVPLPCSGLKRRVAARSTICPAVMVAVPRRGAPSPSKSSLAAMFSACTIASGRSAEALRAWPVSVHPMPSPVSNGWFGRAQISPRTFLARSPAPGWKAASVACTQPEGVNAYCPFCQENVPCPAMSVPRSMAKLKRAESVVSVVKPPPLHTRLRIPSLAAGRPGPVRLASSAICKRSAVPERVKAGICKTPPLAPVTSKGWVRAKRATPARRSARPAKTRVNRARFWRMAFAITESAARNGASAALTPAAAVTARSAAPSSLPFAETIVTLRAVTSSAGVESFCPAATDAAVTCKLTEVADPRAELHLKPVASTFASMPWVSTMGCLTAPENCAASVPAFWSNARLAARIVTSRSRVTILAGRARSANETGRFFTSLALPLISSAPPGVASSRRIPVSDTARSSLTKRDLPCWRLRESIHSCSDPTVSLPFASSRARTTGLTNRTSTTYGSQRSGSKRNSICSADTSGASRGPSEKRPETPDRPSSPISTDETTPWLVK